MNAFENSVFSPWWWEWAPRVERIDAPLPQEADVVVVGSGFTGLMAALTLARAGRDVVVLEAESIGYGASSRNGGQVGSGNQRFTVQQLIGLYGEQKAGALLREGTAALDFVKRFINDESIDCHLRVEGRFRGASRAQHYESMARDAEDLQRFAGVESHMVPRAEQGTEIGSELYHGGCVLPADASLHPALYHRGLLERAEAAGVQLFSNARVEHIEQQAPNQFAVHSQSKVVKARDVLLATNGYTTRQTTSLYDRVVPVASAIIATAELSPNLMAHLMPKRRVYGDTLRVHHYYQPSPDGLRVLFGGRLSGEANTTNPRDFAHLYKDMVDVFPDLKGVDITHSWSGYVAFTRDTLPHIGQKDGVYFAMGYNGSGVARASHAGHQVALQMLGDRNGMTAWNELAFGKWPFHRLSSVGVRMGIAWKRFQDARS